jgi:hypothetical protein
MTEERKVSMKGQMLPGVAGICMYMLLVALVGAFGVFQGKIGAGTADRYAVLAICSLVVVGVFGLLRMRRWGWAVVLTGTLLSSGMYIFIARMTHNPGTYVMSALDFCFFLYLVRTEVRDRLL